MDAVHTQLEAALASVQLNGPWQWSKACKGRLRVESLVMPWRFDGVKTFISLRFVPVRETSDAGVAGEEGGAPDRVLRELRKWEVRLFPSCSAGVFKEKLLRPDANAVRRRTTATRGTSGAPGAAEATLSEAEVKKLPPTPYYNGLVLEDTR